MDSLVHWYTRYRTEKTKIRARQRLELERELRPLAVELGRAIVDERNKGKRIEDIGYMIGLKNKTFIYSMIEEFKHSGEPTPTTPPEQGAVEPAEITFEPYELYDFEYHGNTAVLSIIEDGTPTEYVLGLSNTGEVVTTPEAWLTASKDQRKLYAKIIKEIEDGATP